MAPGISSEFFDVNAVGWQGFQVVFIEFQWRHKVFQKQSGELNTDFRGFWESKGLWRGL